MKIKGKLNGKLQKIVAVVLVLVLALTVAFQYTNRSQAAASSSTTSTTKRMSVHDPSVFYDSSTGKYYIFGSHLAQASSSDLRSWSAVGTQGYNNSTLYASENVEGVYYIQNKFSGLYLDVEDGSGENGANIRQWDYNGSNAQKFKFVSLGDGYYYILTGASGYKNCLDIESGSASDGTNVLQWEYWGGEMQKYRVVQQPDGTYAILSKASGCASGLDVYEWSTEAGGNVVQWNFWGGDCQKWNLIEAESNSGSTVASKGESLETALASSFLWAGYNDQDCSGGTAVWAPDIIYNPSYVWNDGSKGAYMMYYSASSTYIRSCIGYAVSKSVTGPYSYVDTIVYSGFTKSDNNITTTSSLGSKTVNTCYTNTNIPKLIDSGKLSSVRSGWFNSNGSFNNSLFPNAIDPTLLYDASGNLWMTYGSWSGGIYILQLDPKTGQPKYPKSNSGATDGYFGKRIAGGYGLSGEAPYIVYDEETKYYYLYVTCGWLGVDGGYQIRLYRSKTINGTYEDAAGNEATYASASTDPSKIGIKLFGNYDFSTLSTEGYKSGGHNSAFIDTDGQRYLVYHTRFNTGSEYHEVRVHQQFMNEDNWPVTAVYEFLGSSISKTGYSKSDMEGTYEFVNHGTDLSTSNVGMLKTSKIKLNSDGTISGDYSGTWSYTSGTYYCQMKIGGVTYKGVFFKQKDESSSHKEVMTFTLIGKDNKAIWGTKTTASTTQSTTKATTAATTKATTAATTKATTAATTTKTTVASGTTQATTGSAYMFNPSKGLSSSYFTVSGNLASDKGSVTYNGTTLSTCLKVESKTSVKFTTKSANAKLTLIVKSKASGGALKVNGSTTFSSIGTSVQTLTTTLGSAGTYEIKKGSKEVYIYYIIVEEGASGSSSSTTVATTKTTTVATTKATTAATTKATTAATTKATTAATTQQTTTAATTGTTYAFNPGKGLSSSSYFTVAGSLATNKGSVTYSGTTLSTCLKVDSKGSIKFTTKTDGAKLTLVVKAKSSGAALKVNGTTTFSNIGTSVQTVTTTLGSAGTYIISKGSGESYIYYAIVEEY